MRAARNPAPTTPLARVLGLAAAGLALLLALALGASSAGADVLYVPNQGSNSLLVVDPSSGATVGSVPVSSPFSVVVTPDGSRAYVSGTNSGLSVIDTVTNTVVATIPVPATALAISPDGTRVYAAGPVSISAGVLSVIDTSTNAVIGGPAAVPGFPIFATVSPDGTRLFISSALGFFGPDASGVVSVFNAQTLAPLGSIPFADIPFGLATTSTKLYVARYAISSQTLTSEVGVFDIATLAPAGTIPVGAGPVSIALHPDGLRAYVTNFGDDTVSVVNLASNTQTGTIPVGNGPAGVVLSPGGARAYVTNYLGNSVSVIDTSTNTVVDTFAVGAQPLFLAYSGLKIATSTAVSADVNPSTVGQPVTFSATVTASSATPTGTVQFTVDGSPLGGPVTLVNGTATSPSISTLSPGNHMVTAAYSGSTAFSASTGTFIQTVAAKLAQAITFTSTAPANAVFGGTYTVTATGGGSGNPVTFTSATPAVCTVSGATVSFVGIGTCTVNANQAGNAGYEPAPQVSQTFMVAKAPQTITFTSTPVSPTVGGTYTVAATGGGSGNPVTFTSATPAVCTVSGTTVSFVGVGTCTINANQAGNANYNAAAQAPQTFTVAKATPTISTVASAGNLVGAPVRDTAAVAGGFGPTGTVTFKLFSDSGCNTQVFTSTNPMGAPSDWATPTAAGTYRWTATYNGDANNNSVSGPCNAPNESVTLAPFVAPPPTRTISGDLLGPVTVNAGESVVITAGSRVVGPVTVNPGGALTVQNAQISRGITANNPSFLSICGSDVSAPSPATALSVSNAAVPIRIGDPANGCAANRFAGQVTLTANLATTFGTNTVSGAATVTNGGPGLTVIKANTVLGTLACSGNTPAPTNAGQTNTASAKTGQCAGL